MGEAVEIQQDGFNAPAAVNVTVAMKRPREYLTEKEIERLMDAARQTGGTGMPPPSFSPITTASAPVSW